MAGKVTITYSLSKSYLISGGLRVKVYSSYPTKRLQDLRRAFFRLFDQLRHLLESEAAISKTHQQKSKGHVLGDSSIIHQLIDHAFTGSDNDAFVPEPGQCNGDFFLVAAGHAVGQDIDLVAIAQQVERRLGDADVRLDTDDDALVLLGEGGAHLGRDHGEQRLVGVHLGLDSARGIEAKLRACFSQASAVLGGGEDGKFHDLA